MDISMTVSGIILAALFGVYAWTATVIFGISLLRLLPQWDAAGLAARLTRPFWEVSSLILILGLISISSLFTKDITLLFGDVLSTLVIGGAAIVVRTATLLYVSYGAKHTAGPTPANALLAATSFVVLASMAAVGIYLLTGQAFWITPSGWIFMLMMLALFKACGLAFVYWHAKDTADRRLQWATRFATAAFALLAAVAVQLVVREDTPHLLSLPLGILVVVVACTVLWQGALFTTKRADHGIWWYLSLVVVLLPVLLTLANYPWLAYGHYKWVHVYDAAGYSVVVYAGLLSALLALSLGAVAWRRLSRPSSAGRRIKKSRNRS